MLDWEDAEKSFEDSDRFDEDSVCSWFSEQETSNNWRDWRKPQAPFTNQLLTKKEGRGLVVLCNCGIQG